LQVQLSQQRSSLQ